MISAYYGTLAGLVAHHGIFIRGEWHMSAAKIVQFHAIAGAFILYLSASTSGSFTQACSELNWLALYYFLSLFSSITIYRKFFHSLSRFPGPPLAAVTKLWQCFHARDSRNHLLMQKLHEKYGRLVRTGEFLTLPPVRLHC